MKKFYQILLLICLCVCFTGCGKTENTQREKRTTDTVVNQGTEISKESDQDLESVTGNTDTEDDSENKTKILIAYFTRADNVKIDPDIDAVASASINIKGSSYNGNVAILADYIKEATGGDTFSILTAEYYPTNYRDSTNVAKEEQSSDARPELSNHVENMEDYDIIFLGYPNWWGGLPMPVYTFLEEYDFSGKIIIPFASHEGSGLGNGPSEIAEICPDAQIMDGFAARGTEVSSSKADIETWITSLELEQLNE